VLVEATVVGLIASAAGLGLGVAVATGLRALLHAAGIDVPTTTLVVEPRTVIASFVVGTLITLAASLAPARKATKVAPIEALRDATPGAGRVSRVRLVIGSGVSVVGALALSLGLFDGAGIALVGLGVLATFLGVTTLTPVAARPLARLIGSPLRGVAGSLARENAMRNPKRTAATASALMIGLALVASVTVVASSMKASVGDVLDKVNRADLMVKPSNPMAPGLSPAAAAALRDVPGVDTVSEMRYAPARVDGKTTMAFAIDPATIEKVGDLGIRSGSLAAVADGGMLVSEKVAKAQRWHVGDVVSVEFSQTGVHKISIAGIYTAEAALGSDYVVSLDTLARNVTTQLDAVVLVKLAPGVTTDSAKASAEAAVAPFGGAKVDDASGFKKDAQAQFDQLLAIVTVLLLLAVVIALLGIVNTLALSVFERTRELGLLRAIGMTRRQVRSVIRWEAVIIAVLGATLGIVLGIGFGVALSRGLADEGVTALHLPAGQLAVYVVLAGIAGVIAAIAPARRAARVDVLRAVTDA
jgi:putative ABC transport system permease protein